MSLLPPNLGNSAFLANLGEGERSLPRFILTVALGLVAYVAGAVVATLLVLALFVTMGGWPSPATPAGARALMQRFLDLAASDGRDFASAINILTLGLSSNVLPIFAIVGVAALVHRRSFRGFATSAPRYRWRLLLVGLVLATLLVGPFVLVSQAMDPKAGPWPVLSVSTDLGQRAIYILVCLAGFLPAAMGEEFLFRGWLLRQTSNVTRNVAVLLIANGIIFAAAHLDFAPDAFLERAVMGAGLAYMTLRIGGIELSSGAHASNNLLIVLFIEPLTLKKTPNTGIDASELIPVLGIFVAYVLIAEAVARWAPLRRLAGVDRGQDLAASAEAEHFA